MTASSGLTSIASYMYQAVVPLLGFSPEGEFNIGIVIALLAVVVSLFIMIAILVVSVFYLICYFKAMWGIYRIFAPEYSVLFLMLSIFVADISPIAIFALRNREPQNLRADGEGNDTPEIDCAISAQATFDAF